MFLLFPIILLSVYSPTYAANTTNEGKFIQLSKKYLGVPYHYGGTSPSGFDCSGFINYVLKEYGYSIPRTTADMYASQDLSSVKDLKVGDILFFTTYKPGASHAGLYIGNNEFIHASTSKGVTVSKLEESYWDKRYLGAKRHNQLSSDLSFSTDAEAKKLWQNASNHYMTSAITTQNQEFLSTYQSLRNQVIMDGSTQAGQYLLKSANLIDSVNLSSRLADSTNQLTSTMISNQVLNDDSVAMYHQHSANIKKSETVYSRLYGSELRKRFNNESITPAKIARETVIYEVSMYGLLGTIEDTVDQGNNDQARNLLQKYDRLENRAHEIKVLGNTIHSNAYQSLDQINKQLEERENALKTHLQVK
jgi:NlpC/P60 family/SbsC C-terminal domain